MKRFIKTGTDVTTYRNKRNPNKKLEVHRDGYGHTSVKQYMDWKKTGVKNPTGDGNLHRWRKDNIDELLEDYEEVESSNNITSTLHWFYKWYDKLSAKQQALVDNLADDLGLPLYDDCTENQLIDLHDQMENTFQYDVTGSCVKASWDPTEADLYIVKIWHEIEANAEDTYGPEAAEEIFEIVAGSPQDAIEQAKRSWSGPIDRIEIVDINPEDKGELDAEELYPFNSSRKVSASFDSSTNRNLSQLSFDFVHDGYYSIDDMEVIVSAALEENGCEYQASQFESVDYSSYPEYADFNISQMSVDFTWVDNYDAKAITDSISRRLSSINYALIGIDFRSID